MSEVSREKIESALEQVIDPHMDLSLLASKAVRDIRIEDGAAVIDLSVGYPCARWADTLKAMVSESLAQHAMTENITINVSHNIIAHSVQHGVKRLNNVKNIIAVASGKGGVGKSTTSLQHRRTSRYLMLVKA